MAMKIEDLAKEALALSSKDRALLADRLVESLDPIEDMEVREAWIHEANRRMEELRSGEVKGLPGEEASARIRKKYMG